MAFRELPTFYYHTHFMEFLDFVKGPSAPLLNTDHIQFLDKFESLSHLEQCLVVRLINRKHPVVKLASLKYAEIPNLPEILNSIIDKGFASYAKQLPKQVQLDQIVESANHLSQIMTKPELSDLYHSCIDANLPKLPKSANKAIYTEHCQKLSPNVILQSNAAQAYIFRQTDQHLDYFLFLYFGHNHGTLNQFSMRDLGIMRTRDQQAQMQSRFVDYESAYSSFKLRKTLSEVKRQHFSSEAQINQVIKQLPQARGIQAEDFDQRIRFILSKAKLACTPSIQALTELERIASPEAQEFWCRQAFKMDLKSELEIKLNEIIDNPLSERLLHFAEDFLARKFHKKRTSILTDMLRDNTRHLAIDETYKGSVEHGVIAYYQSRSIQAWRTENILWQNLFGLLFWPELFEIDGLGLATPFDHLPLCIKQNQFLTLANDEIHRRLNTIHTEKDMIVMVTKHCAKYFGQSQGMVRWHANILDNIVTLIAHSPLTGIKQQLLSMCANWSLYNDGYPDIMVLENNQLRFEEIKAQGDSLRRNQLMQIQALKQYGFDVGITTVEWTLDPKQAYAIIDIETTGGRAGTHRITEIGMVKMVNGEVVDQWQSLLNPERRIPHMITDLTGINNEMVADAPLFVDIADELEKFTENCIFVAHNVNFDYSFIREEFARINRTFRRPKLCTVQQMRKYYKGLKSYSLANLTRHFDIQMQRHHRALSDAIAASELLKLVNSARTNTP